MRVLYLFSLLIIFSLNISAQENRDFTEIYENAEAVLFTQPQQTSKITSHLIQNSENSSEKIKAYILNAGSQYAMGEYNNEVTALLAAKTLAESSNDIQSQIRISVLSIPLLNNLGLNAVAEKYYLKIKVLSKNSKNEQNSFYLSAAKILIEAQKHSEHDNAIESLNTLEAANAHFKKIPDIILQTQTEVKILETYSSAKGIDSAKIYFTKILKNKNKASINDFITMVTLNQMGKIFFLQKEYLNARISFENALDISNELENKTYRSKIIDGLSATFLAMDDTSNFFSNRTKSDSLANEAEMEEENAINTLYNYIII